MMASRLNLLIAHADGSNWPNGLERALAPLPVRLLHSTDCDHAMGMAADPAVHVAIIDDALPREGGLSVLRRLRSSGLTLPVLLVASELDRRLMEDAIQLNAFSVVAVDDRRDLVTPVVFRLVRQVYRVDWLYPGDSAMAN
ncbi:MAG: hypothetical protein KF841_00065 [Phycisphaerae bacterium]|nr:hypothetical protein [Phycisphaerae bacterium]